MVYFKELVILLQTTCNNITSWYPLSWGESHQSFTTGVTKMQIIALIGAFGAGKSATAVELATQLRMRGSAEQIVIAVNETGGMTEIRTNAARVVVLPNGCFTCQDEADLQRALAKFVEDGVELVIMEGFGIVGGHETEAFLAKSGHSFQIIGLVDAQRHPDNRIRYSAVLPTHVAHATAGIIVTKCEGDVVPDEVMAFIAEHNGRQLAVYPTIEPEVPGALLTTALQERVVHGHQCGHGCGHDHDHHHHEHNHDHHHEPDGMVHGYQTVPVALRDDVTLTDLQAVLQAAVTCGDVRVKGEVEGVSFNATFGDQEWRTERVAGAGQFLICYLQPGFSIAELPGLAALVQEVLPATDFSHALLREHVDPERERELIWEGIAQISQQPPVVNDGRLVTHPEELQIIEAMARRPDHKAELFPQVMRACVEYWVRCARWLYANHDEVESAARATHERELGVSLAWWTNEFSECFPADLVEAVQQLHPALLVERGIRELSGLREDNFWRFWQGVEYLRALNFCFDLHSSDDQQALEQSSKKVISWAQNDTERQAFRRECGHLVTS